MQRKYGLTICAVYAVCIAGCTSTFDHPLIRDELAMWSGAKIVSLTLDNGSVVSFNDEGGRLIRVQQGKETKAAIAGITNYDEHIQIDLNTVVGAKVERSEFSVERSALLILTLLTGVLVTLLIIALSSI